MVTIHKTFKYS